MTEEFIRRHLRTRCRLAAILLAGILLLAMASQVTANLFGGPEPLAPELAFSPEIVGVSDQAIDIEFSIADGYYLYRDKLGFTAGDTPASGSQENALNPPVDSAQSLSVTFGKPEFAEALITNDDFFGEQAIFRTSTLITLPYSALPQIDKLTLDIKFQGCADIGLCYPPTTTKLDVNLPARADVVSSNAPLSGQFSPSSNTSSSQVGLAAPSLGDLLGADDNSEQLLPPELAYLPQIIAATPEAIDINWFIEDGYYLYRDKLSFSLTHSAGLAVSETFVTQGVEQFDEFFGNVAILRKAADARLALTGDTEFADIAGSQGQLTIRYQGCADIGVCFPPSETTLPVSFNAVASSPPQNSELAPLASASASTSGSNNPQVNSAVPRPATPTDLPAQSEQDRLSSLLGTSSLWLTVATFFGLGLLLAFTPCVLPMIPILSSLIVGQGSSITTGRAFQLSLVYVLVMASTYALVGIVVGLSGYNVQAFLQDPVVLSGIAILFVLLSLSMFGFYELQIPVSMQDKLTKWSNKQGGGQVGGVAAMGFISTLIVGPCVTAPLAGALIYIAKTGDAVVGGAALFALGLGMGAPLLLIGTSAGKLLPKTGAWMNTTKAIFGILMLCMAVYMISRFISTNITMLLYGIIALMSGVYLGATDSISAQSSGWQRFGKGAGLIIAVYGLALLVGALSGGKSYTMPLGALAGGGNASGSVQTDHALPFQRVKSVDNLNDVVAQASAQGRPVMLDFYADWCISCKEMEAFTFSDDQVRELLSTAIVIQADVTANDAEDQAMLKQFNLFGPPGIIFYNAAGQELPAARVVGFMNADDFSAHIRRFIISTET